MTDANQATQVTWCEVCGSHHALGDQNATLLAQRDELLATRRTCEGIAALLAQRAELYAALRQAERVLALVGNPEKLSDYDAALSQVRAALAKVEGLTP